MASSQDIDGVATFFQSPAGQYLLDWELSQHDQYLANVFGYYAVQIGWPEIDYLRKNRILKRHRIGSADPATVIAENTELPIETASMDLVVLPHQLEFSENPHQILREVERVLVPEGKLVIVGFNPISFWGLTRWLSDRGSHPSAFPRNGRYIRLSRLKDWLKLLNLEMTTGRFGCYRPLLSNPKWTNRLNSLESMGDRWWPTFGALYLVCATKKVYGMRLMTEPWRKKLETQSAASVPLLPSRIENLHEH